MRRCEHNLYGTGKSWSKYKLSGMKCKLVPGVPTVSFRTRLIANVVVAVVVADVVAVVSAVVVAAVVAVVVVVVSAVVAAVVVAVVSAVVVAVVDLAHVVANFDPEI